MNLRKLRSGMTNAQVVAASKSEEKRLKTFSKRNIKYL
jgi:hypothetical protein